MWDEMTTINFKLPSSLKRKLRRRVGSGKMSIFIRACVEKELARIENSVDIQPSEIYELEPASWYDLDLVYNEEENLLRDEVLAISKNGKNINLLVIPFCNQIKNMAQKEADPEMVAEYLFQKMESYE